MKKLLEAELKLQAIKLRQMGGNVTVINSKMCYVKFDVSGVKVSYAYNVNKKGRYFLERIQPYPLPFKEYDREETIVEMIRIDLEQFKNAVKSDNINSFIEINRKLHSIMEKFEDLFLYYNVPAEENKVIFAKLTEIEDEIEQTKQTADRIYYGKDPDSL